uniref:Uncharacterized protein n=1 Tax=Peronospora matthiolae TaxID=2874970 RepID=A0AAV1TWR3_9STRA
MTERAQVPVQNPVSGSRSTAVAAAIRTSPFASGPVAMVNQIRPGFSSPGQFPGQPVRAIPTQLSTPLAPQRHLSVPLGGSSSESSPVHYLQAPPTLPDAIHNSPGKQATPIPELQRFGPTGPLLSQHDQSRADPFDGLSIPAPLNPTQHKHENVRAVHNRMAPDNFAVSSFASGPSTQQDPYESLFDSPEGAMTFSSMLSRRSSLPSSQSLSPSSSSRSDAPRGATQQNESYQQRQQSPLRAFGQTPPPAAPFLGYDDKAWLLSDLDPAPSSSTPDLLIFDAETKPSQARPTPSEAASRSPSLCQSTCEAPILNDLADGLLKLPIAECLGSTKNAIPNGNTPVPDTIEGLEVLYAQKRWRSLTKKSFSMLQSLSGDTNMALEIKSWWLAGLIKDGQFANATNVLDQIGNLDKLSIAGGTSPFVPIRLLLLQALLSKCQGEVMTHEQQLFHLILRLRNAIQQNETMSLFGAQLRAAAQWLRIAQFALVNHLVHQQKFMMALRICSQIDNQFMDENDKVVVLSRVGRIRLQMGDLAAAEKLFKAARYFIHPAKASGDSGTATRSEVLCELEARLLLNDGLLFFAQNKLQEALRAFDSILRLQNSQVLSSANSDAEVFLDEDIVCSAVNNYAVCALYCCDVKAAVVALERMIKLNPQRFLNGVVVFNLSSLYDLQSDNATSKSRKELMKKIAHIYGLEHVDPAAYRI